VKIERMIDGDISLPPLLPSLFPFPTLLNSVLGVDGWMDVCVCQVVVVTVVVCMADEDEDEDEDEDVDAVPVVVEEDGSEDGSTLAAGGSSHFSAVLRIF